jgi:hypothetical protein
MTTIKLTRQGDGKVLVGSKFKWIEWNEDGSFANSHDLPEPGRSLILDPHLFSHTWLTTTINEFTQTPSGWEFKTENSNYILEILNHQEND